MSDPARDELRRAGDAVVARLRHGTQPPRDRPLHLGSVRGLSHYTNEALWGSVWARPGLDVEPRVLCTLAVLSSLQRLPQLRTYLHSALNLGIERRAIEEVLVQCSVQAGFPTTVNSLELLREVLERRGVEVPDDADPAAEAEASLDELTVRGRELRARLFGADLAESPGDDSPNAVLERIEGRYVLGDIYSRPGLSLEDRVACTIAALVALRAEGELARWLVAGARLGMSTSALGEVILQAAYYAGFPAAAEGMALLTAVLGPDA